jgi:hypothetical protein
MLLGHLQRTGDRIAAFGEFIPAEYLNAHVDCGWPPWERPSPTQPLLRDIGRTCNLLNRDGALSAEAP